MNKQPQIIVRHPSRNAIMRLNPRSSASGGERIWPKTNTARWWDDQRSAPTKAVSSARSMLWTIPTSGPIAIGCPEVALTTAHAASFKGSCFGLVQVPSKNKWLRHFDGGDKQKLRVWSSKCHNALLQATATSSRGTSKWLIVHAGSAEGETTQPGMQARKCS